MNGPDVSLNGYFESVWGGWKRYPYIKLAIDCLTVGGRYWSLDAERPISI